MSSDKITAERDALIRALKLAESEIAKARAGQQRAEARFTELSAEMHAQRAKYGTGNDGSHPALSQAQAGQRRAESRVQYLEAQLHGKQMEFDALQGATDALRTENEQLRSQIQAVEAALREKEAEVGPWQKEATEAKAEVQRLRSIVLQATIGSERPVPASAKPGLEPKTGGRHPQTQPEGQTRAETEPGYGRRSTYQQTGR